MKQYAPIVVPDAAQQRAGTSTPTRRPCREPAPDRVPRFREGRPASSATKGIEARRTMTKHDILSVMPFEKIPHDNPKTISALSITNSICSKTSPDTNDIS